MTNIGQDGDIGHQVLAANIADSAVGGACNIEDCGALFGDIIVIGGGVEDARVAGGSNGEV